MKTITACLIILSCLIGRASACTGIYAYQNNVALAGNNEDYWNPNIKMWFVPSEPGSLGRVYFGFDNLFPQGGMNEKGLFFDGFATQAVPVTKSRHKKRMDANLLDRVMAKCSTVDEVVAEFDKYNLEFLEKAMLFYADRHGNSAIIEGDSIVRKKGRYQICTNFHQSQSTPDKYTCRRYKAADSMLSQSKEISIDLFRRILDAAHAEGPSYTLYSNICDLTNGKIYLYHFHNFENVVVLDLAEELKKGKRVIDIPTLFPENSAWTKFLQGREVSLDRKRKALTATNIEPAVYDEYVGRYEVMRDGTAVNIDITCENHKLFVQVKDQPKVEILPSAPDRFFQLDYFGTGKIVFVRNADGAVEQFVLERGGRKFEASRLNSSGDPDSWTFVSMPDFLNVDTDFPQPGWEPALDVVLKSVKQEEPDFLLVAGDLLMGHWFTAEDIEKYAARYYPAWLQRIEKYDLRVYAAIGDHELGDNPWPDWKTALVPAFKQKFRHYMKMPQNGPAHMLGTAFWWRHKDVLFIAVDVFERAQGSQGGITAQVTGKQLAWFEDVLDTNSDAAHIIVMGHTPVLGPVRAWSSSRLMLKGGRNSPFWKTMSRHGVDLYLCGEVHAITCIERDGIMQIAHGGLIGYNTRTNYLVGTVTPNRIELELKEIDLVPSGEKLWQPGTNRPLEKVAVTDEVRRRGFLTVGRVVLQKNGSNRQFARAAGYFDPRLEPAKPQSYRPYGQSEPPRVVIED